MPLPRRDARYSVQDVLEMIQNGESDVDIDFNETDEESDDEGCASVMSVFAFQTTETVSGIITVNK